MLKLEISEKFNVEKYLLGNEKAPLLVIDNYLADPEILIEQACNQSFSADKGFYPGVRSPAPPEFLELFIETMSDLVLRELEIPGNKLKLFMSHYSLVTKSPRELHLLQRIPHFDSLDTKGLAMVYYLFKKPLGGTSFYRHRKTGFEIIDESRKETYFKSLESENGGPNIPGAEYINGNTPLFEQIASQEGVFNRMLVYRRNSLHSGDISPDFVPDANPLTGRLSITCFLDAL